METNRSSIGFEVSEDYWKDLQTNLDLLLPPNIQVTFDRAK